MKYFLATWRDAEECRKIVTRKWMRFALCTDCVAFRTIKGWNSMSPADKDAARKKHRVHLVAVKRERAAYYARRARAKARPLLYVSWIADGFDQSRCGLPSFFASAHDVASLLRMPMHVMGTLDHGHGVLVQLVHPACKQGANVTIEAIHRAIVARVANHGLDGLPPHLYMQLDNTSKQCKNRFVLAFLAYLVHIGVFSVVTVSFLMVGHTHEDIDQFFSRLSKALTASDVPSRIAMAEIFAEAHSAHGWKHPTPVVEFVDAVANISDYLLPHIQPLQDISTYRQFRLRAYKGDEGKREVRVSARATCLSDGEDWVALDGKFGRGSAIFKPAAATERFLAAKPFSSVVPPSQRTTAPPVNKGSMSDAEHRHAVESKAEEHKQGNRRVASDVRKAIEARHIGGEHAADLNAALELLVSTAALPFRWDTAVYVEAQRRLAERKKKAADGQGERDLAAARKKHPLDSFVMLRLDAADGDPELFALAKVKGHVLDDDGWVCLKVRRYCLGKGDAAKEPGQRTWKPTTGLLSEEWLDSVTGGTVHTRAGKGKDTAMLSTKKTGGDKQTAADAWAWWEDKSKKERAGLRALDEMNEGLDDEEGFLSSGEDAGKSDASEQEADDEYFE